MVSKVINVVLKNSMIFEMDSEKLEKILNNLKKNYKNDKIMINLSPSGYGYAMHPRTEEEFREEFCLTEDDFNKLMNDMMFILISLVMDKEERVFKEYGKTQKAENVLNEIKQQMKNFIESLRFKLFCKTQYLEDFSWDVSIRVRQTGGIKMQFPLSVIKMSFSKAGSPFSPILGEANSITFECTLHDIEIMIESLEEIKNTLVELQKEEG